MIVAYCDRCGKPIDRDTAAGCRIVVGRQETRFHLCDQHQEELRDHLYMFVVDEGQQAFMTWTGPNQTGARA